MPRVLNMPLVLNMLGFWLYQGSERVCGSEYTRVLNMTMLHKLYTWIGVNYSWICLNMHEYAKICVNMPKTAWMAFYVFVSIEILCLVERVVIYFNEVYSVKKWGYFLEEKKIDFLYSSWMYLIYFFLETINFYK